ncbi:carboxymuconolactone decarboxylase family protein [Streptomyces sp. NPDC054863]
MEARMANPATLIPGALPAILGLAEVAKKGDVPEPTLELVHLRVSQINGCSVCVVMGTANARKSGESDERLDSVAVWREAPYFTDAERAALALAECATRLADRSDPVPDDVWNEAAAHYTEKQLAGLTLWIGLTNFFNRVNATTRQIAGAKW